MFHFSFDKRNYIEQRQWKMKDYLPTDENITELESIFKKQMLDIHLDNYRTHKLQNLYFECVLNISKMQFEIHSNLLKFKREEFIQIILNRNIDQILESCLNKVSQILLYKFGSDLYKVLENIFVKPKSTSGTDWLLSHQVTSSKYLFLSVEMKNCVSLNSLRAETIDSIWICCLLKAVFEILIETDYGKQIVVEEVNSIITGSDSTLNIGGKEYEFTNDDLDIEENMFDVEQQKLNSTNEDNTESSYITKLVQRHKHLHVQHQQLQPILDLNHSSNANEIILDIDLPRKLSEECISNILGLEVFTLAGGTFTTDINNWSRLYLKNVNKLIKIPFKIYLREFPTLVNLQFLVRFLVYDDGKRIRGPISNIVSCTLNN